MPESPAVKRSRPLQLTNDFHCSLQLIIAASREFFWRPRDYEIWMVTIKSSAINHVEARFVLGLPLIWPESGLRLGCSFCRPCSDSADVTCSFSLESVGEIKLWIRTSRVRIPSPTSCDARAGRMDVGFWTPMVPDYSPARDSAFGHRHDCHEE